MAAAGFNSIESLRKFAERATLAKYVKEKTKQKGLLSSGLGRPRWLWKRRVWRTELGSIRSRERES